MEFRVYNHRSLTAIQEPGASDAGRRIRPQDKPRIFERFFQANPARGGDSNVRGTGLGLAIVKHACERLGARITIDSKVGRGTTVTVIVPANVEGQ